jgi:hypothetical protein
MAFHASFQKLTLGFPTGTEKPAVLGPQVLQVRVQVRKLIPVAIPYPYLRCHGYWWVFWPELSLEKNKIKFVNRDIFLL